MKSNYLNQEITKLEISDKLKEKLFSNKINSINDLWHLSRKDLKKMDFSDDEINQVIIKLQLLGIDLNHKVYNKD